MTMRLLPSAAGAPRRPSLHARLTAVTLLVLGGFLGAVGWLLDVQFRGALLDRTHDELRTVAHALLTSATEETPDRLSFDARADPRLNRPGEGLHGFVRSLDGELLWESPYLRLAGLDRDRIPATPGPGESALALIEPAQASAAGISEPDAERLVLGYTVIWESLDDMQVTLWIIDSSGKFGSQMRDFRTQMAVGFGAVALAFALIQLAALRWGLRPVRVMAERVRSLERASEAASEGIGDDYPAELAPLARNLNRFVEHERASRDRYRRAMDDLAHGLKTPLAVLRNAFRDLRPTSRDVLDEQVSRMDAAVSHQLSRAAASQGTPGAAIALAPVATRLARALDRAWPDKRMAVAIDAAEVQVHLDEGDLMEILGNLMENAYKYARSRVRVRARTVGDVVEIRIDDDGPGISPSERRSVLERGARADTAAPGHGIGLAVVAELTSIYQGRFAIGTSDLGGASMELDLPARMRPSDGR
ncbi:MAG: hypothetical protein F4Y86_15585 [Gammaproteobacteria bacterium]|nr:hypothetical protein [Gammaproteobacteria bacterium]MYB39297.1 hypothetical protein [Gammaproteobacteria bacterium]